MRHPLEARTLARLAAHHAGDGPGQVVGFGLSNDERRGETSEFAHAFAIARDAGLASVPHGGELLGPAHVEDVVEHLHPDRLGHGVPAAEDPRVLARVVDEGVALEVCPASNVSLGVYAGVATSRCARWSTPARPWRSAPTTRCCSGRGWSTSTARPRGARASPTTSSRTWRGRRSGRAARATASGRGCSPAWTRGSRLDPAAADSAIVSID